jgi:adenine-specific DNA-methyltransferase
MPSLSWLHKQHAEQAATKVPHHLLTVQSVHGDTTAGNLLIQGDNLLALKALLPAYRGRVKCIFIDPPYNTQSAFAHYNDKLEHSLWLTMMLPRLQLLRDLLSEDGSIWVTIDDNEGHYLKVLMDEVFVRNNFVANVVWEKSDSPKMDSQLFSTRHDHLLVFSKNNAVFKLKRLATETAAHYDKTDGAGRLYYLKPLRAMGGQGDSREVRPNLYYALIAPDGTEVFPKRTDNKDGAWRWSRDKVAEESARIEWRNGKKGWSAYFRIYADSTNGRPAETIWTHSEVGSNRTSKAEVKALLASDGAFTTPKPEALLARVFNIATDKGDLVLDSFLGSGTTAAVAHKMGRRWIGIEMGEHARTHCLPRLEKVVAGEQGGISKAVNWLGGGGFRFLTLGNAIFDELGRIDTNVVFTDLAAFVWQQETGTPAAHAFTTPCLGVHDGTQYFLLFNGILGDKRPEGGNVLTYEVFDALVHIYPFDGPRVVFGEAVKLPPTLRVRERVTFKKIPYSLRGQGAM